MEPLFSTNLAVNNANVVYNVIFEDEQYRFLPETTGSAIPAFALCRNHDEWQEQSLLAPELKKQAVDALEKYLLQQH